MTAVNVFEAKSTLSKLLADLESKVVPEVVIARAGKPVARLVPLATDLPAARVGLAAGAFIVPEDIDTDNAEVARLFFGAKP